MCSADTNERAPNPTAISNDATWSHCWRLRYSSSCNHSLQDTTTGLLLPIGTTTPCQRRAGTTDTSTPRLLHTRPSRTQPPRFAPRAEHHLLSESLQQPLCRTFTLNESPAIVSIATYYQRTPWPLPKASGAAQGLPRLDEGKANRQTLLLEHLGDEVARSVCYHTGRRCSPCSLLTEDHQLATRYP